MTTRRFSMVLKVSALTLMTSFLGVESAWAQLPWEETRRYCPEVFDSVRDINGWARCLGGVTGDWPVHIAVANVGPASGIGLGTMWPSKANQAYKGTIVSSPSGSFVSTNHVMTKRIRGAANKESSELILEIHAYRMTELNLYGANPTAPKERQPYAFREIRLGARGSTPISGSLSLSGGVQFRRPSLSAETILRFSRIRVPDSVASGYAPRSEFVQPHATLAWHASVSGFKMKDSVTGSVFLATGNARSFAKFDIVHVVKNESPKRSLLLVARLTSTKPFDGDTVPFYFKPTFGGRDFDGVQTFRASDDHRFRGAHRAFLQVDFRHDIGLGRLQPLILGDIGQVAESLEGFALKRLRADVGLGVDLVFGGTTKGQLFWAYGGSAGNRFGHSFSIGI